MAKGQQQGVGAITIWMIVFVALWLTSTVFLIILYTGQEELNDENKRLRHENERLISSNENRSLELIRDAKPGGPTAVGILESARSETSLLATGDGSDDPETVRSKRDQLISNMVHDGVVADGDTYDGLSLLEAATRLYEAHRAMHARLGEVEKRLDELDVEAARLVELNAEQKNDFDVRAKEFTDQMAKLESDRQADNTERDARIARLVAEFDSRREEADAELTAERQEKSAIRRDLSELRKRLVAQQEKTGGQFGGPEKLATARQADGHILSAIPGDDIVYVDLGHAHHLTLGMRFSVYSREDGIPADGRGKGQIEVVSVAESSAECRVVYSRLGEPILEGDWVANPIYDPNRALSFMAVGEFDLDHDGMPDRDGIGTIEAMVIDWGGEMASEVTATTDFVIVGAMPVKPKAISDQAGERTTRQIARQRAWDRYRDALGSARNMAIPLLPQEVFLNFLGYGRAEVRR